MGAATTIANASMRRRIRIHTSFRYWESFPEAADGADQ